MKKYWKVRMTNGGHKIVYLTKEEAFKWYDYNDYTYWHEKIHFTPILIG